jgi:putrescine transport system substrate-binding protein
MKKHVLVLCGVGSAAGCLRQEGRAGSPWLRRLPRQQALPRQSPPPAEEKVLNIYNWPDYIPEGMIAAFEKETGIKVNYDTFETNEALHAKLVAGNSGYDIVVPGTVFAKPQIEGGLLQPLDKSKIPNLANLDPAIMTVPCQGRPGQQVPGALGLGLHDGRHQQDQG